MNKLLFYSCLKLSIQYDIEQHGNAMLKFFNGLALSREQQDSYQFFKQLRTARFNDRIKIVVNTT